MRKIAQLLLAVLLAVSMFFSNKPVVPQEERERKAAAHVASMDKLKKELVQLKRNATKQQAQWQEEKKALEASIRAALFPDSPDQTNKLSPQVSASDSIAACLMVMDDNHFLIEWLAFHYHVLPLRRLIVLPDPNSSTSPANILHRWQGRINSTIFTMKDVFPDGKPKIMQTDYGTTLIRQNIFYNQCLKQLKTEGFSWTMLTDVDEYTHIHPQAYDVNNQIYNLGFDDTQWKIPPLQQPGSVVAVLKQAARSNNTLYGLTDACIGITRLFFGATEDNSIHNYTKSVQRLGFNLSHFATFRWRHRDPNNQIGKVILDMSKIPFNILNVVNPHVPILEVCSEEKAWTRGVINPLIGHHYSGTLEQSLVRAGDHWTTNKTERFYRDKQRYRGAIAPISIREWLDGFVDSVGVEAARHLLKHVGQTKESPLRS